jgi:hypothetical protein
MDLSKFVVPAEPEPCSDEGGSSGAEGGGRGGEEGSELSEED